MSAAVTRTLKITYAGTLVGGTTDYLIHGPIRMSKTYQRFTLEFQVIVQDTSAATFNTKCATLEAAYRTPRGALLIEMESETFISLSHTGNTGFLAEPEITKIGDRRTDTGRSRLYACRVSCQMPADLAGQSGRLDSTTTLDYDASRRRRITIEGVYTALSSNSASAQYEAAIGTYASTVLSAFGSGGTFNLVREDEIPDDANKNCRFRREYIEEIYASTAGGLGHASIRNSTITYSQAKPSPGDSPGKGARRAQEIEARITCNVDKTVTTGLEALWTTAIRPYLLAQVASRFSAGVIAILNEDVRPDPTANTLTGVLMLSVVGAGSGTLSYSVSTEVDDDLGVLLQDAWGGSLYSKYEHYGIANATKIVEETEVRLGLWSVSSDRKTFIGGGNAASSSAAAGGASSAGGAGAGGSSGLSSASSSVQVASAPAPSAAGAGGGGESGSGGSGWVEVRHVLRAAPLRVCEGSDRAYDVTACMTRTIWRYRDKPAASGGGPVTTSSGGAAPGPFLKPGGAITP